MEMMDTFWHKQSVGEPLFPDMIWNKPENRAQAGKLLVIGGNAHEFAAPGEAYSSAVRTGVGTAKVLLPMALQKTIGAVLENAEFAPSNKSGGFARTALSEWLSYAHWADAVLIAGDLGRNSETGIVLESFLQKYSDQTIITKDAVDYFYHQPKSLLKRKNTTLVVSFAQLQKLIAPTGIALKFSMTLQQLVEALHVIGQTYATNIVVEHNGIILAASEGKISTTKLADAPETWRVDYAARASVWLLQNPTKPFEALTTSIAA